MRQVARDDKASAIFKSWESHGLLASIAPQIAKRHPDYEAVTDLTRAKEELIGAGLRHD